MAFIRGVAAHRAAYQIQLSQSQSRPDRLLAILDGPALEMVQLRRQKMKVNGKIYSLAQPLSLKDFLEEKGFNSDRVAVELNGDIIPKGAYETTMLSDADTLEVVHFVGGG